MLALARTRAVLERGVAEGLHAGAQLCVRRGGEIAGELALGLAGPDRALRPDSIVLWFSSVKPLMAVAIGQLVERGLVAFDDPAAKHLPEFGANGKRAITLRHLLTHSAAIPNAHREWSRESWDEILAKICAAAPEPDWEIGRDCGYHVASAWYVLGEIVRRRDGRSYDRYVREAIFAPLGLLDFWVGMSAADYAANQERIAPLYDATRGAPERSSFWAWSGSAEALALCRPGGSGWGTARALSGLYAALLRGDSPILRADTVRCLTAPALCGRDRIFQVVLERGLGVVLDSKAHGDGSAWYGRRASARSFGHGGYFSSVAFGDPEHALAVALAWSCVAPPASHQARLLDALDALYFDLGAG
ncbi:MAG TPA: serine hydrolase domain-containing protein [Myxococcota bacterium]|nr:serine hydrolase domain-containing protein [Myxococcota bacterium]